MAANQVVLYFDRQEDAMQFTLAASSVISAEEPVGNSEVMAKVTRKSVKPAVSPPKEPSPAVSPLLTVILRCLVCAEATPYALRNPLI